MTNPVEAREAANAEQPSWVRTAWRLAESEGQADDAPGLNARKIVLRAIEVADEEGLNGLSIRKLAARLGSSTMAAYRHVESREALIALMVDTALDDPPTVDESAPWRPRVAELALSLFARYRRHPWLVEAPAEGLTTTPHRARWFESLLVALNGSGLELADILASALLIDGHLRSVAGLAHSIEIQDPSSASSPAESGRFPMLDTVLGSGAFDPATASDPSFGLNTILDGLEMLAAGSAAAQ